MVGIKETMAEAEQKAAAFVARKFVETLPKGLGAFEEEMQKNIYIYEQMLQLTEALLQDAANAVGRENLSRQIRLDVCAMRTYVRAVKNETERLS